MQVDEKIEPHQLNKIEQALAVTEQDARTNDGMPEQGMPSQSAFGPPSLGRFEPI